MPESRAGRLANTACTALAFVLVGARWNADRAAVAVREWLLDREVTRWANETHVPQSARSGQPPAL